MANRERGEVGIQGPDGKGYTFVLTLNAMCELEQKADVPFQAFVKNLDTISRIRLLFWCAAREHHPDLDEAAIGSLLQSAGGIRALTPLLTQLMTATNPDAMDIEEAKPKGAGARPRKAQDDAKDGTGAASTSKLARSA
jgi:hypothetical protein